MQFRRSGQRDERRRRVLIEEARGQEQESGKRGSRSAAPSRQYSAAAQQQPQVTNLIPVRPLRVLITMLVGATLLVGLVVIDDWAFRSGAPRGQETLRAFDLGQPGSLSSWFSSTLLSWAAIGCVLTYLIRRHRTDDYRGAYYLWLWTAAMLVVASVCVTAPLHLALNRLLTQLTGVSLGQHGWWLAVTATASATMMLRLGFEVRRCRTALALLAVAAAGYLLGSLIRTEAIWPDMGQAPRLAECFAVLIGHLALANAVWLYARYVQLEAQGVVSAGASRANRKRKKKTLEKAEPKARDRQDSGDSSDQPSGSAGRRKSRDQSAPQSKTRRSEQRRQDEEESDDEVATIDLEEQRRLSKSERRRLRKMKRRQAA